MIPTFYLGLDLGQARDFTALAVLERTEQAAPNDPERMQRHYACRHLRRWPLGTPYPAIVANLAQMIGKEPLAGSTLVVDRTGVGMAVVDMLKAQWMPCRLLPVLITSGHAFTLEDDGLHLPKKELASVMQVLLQTHRLKIAKALEEAAVLEKELLAFKVKVSATGNETFEAWRERDHDDLVLAISLAAWVGEHEPEPYRGPLVYTEHELPAADQSCGWGPPEPAAVARPPRDEWKEILQNAGRQMDYDAGWDDD